MSIRKKTYGFLLLVVVFASVCYFALPYLTSHSDVSSADGKVSEEATQPDGIPVTLAVAFEGEIASSISTTANLKALRSVEVASQAEGVVREISVEEGEFVQAGQMICRLDDIQSQIRLASAREKLAQARLQLEKAEIQKEKADVQVNNSREEFRRFEELYAEKLVSEREVSESRYRLEELLHDLRASSSAAGELAHRVEELESEIAQVELEIKRARVVAPFAGFVTRRLVELGQTVRNLDPVVELADFSPLLAEVFVSEKEAAQIRPGQTSRVYSGVDDAATATGRVARISPVVDANTGTVKVTVELSGSSGLFKPGAFVRVAIQTDSRTRSVLIPKNAVVEEDGEEFVFVANEGSAVRTAVELGYENGESVEVLRGVRPGEAIVVAGQGGLKDGTKIRRVGEPSPTA